MGRSMIERYSDKEKMAKERSKKTTKKTKNRIGCLLIIVVGLIFYVLYGSSFLAYRANTFCTKAESDAHVIAAHIVDYFSDPNHATIPTFEQLKNWKNFTLSGKNTATITGTDPNGPIIITVTDGSGKCPIAYQNRTPNWDGTGVYKLTISNP